MFHTVSPAVTFVVSLCIAAAFPDGAVVLSGGPTFPLQVDKVKLWTIHAKGKKFDTSSVLFPVSLYGEFRDNIDTVFTYVEALRKHRPELAISSDSLAGRPCLSFEYMGLWVVRVFFLNNGFKSGKLVAAVDRYPFVVIMTRGFSKRLEKLAGTK
jgi:hypothetical protein